MFFLHVLYKLLPYSQCCIFTVDTFIVYIVCTVYVMYVSIYVYVQYMYMYCTYTVCICLLYILYVQNVQYLYLTYNLFIDPHPHQGKYENGGLEVEESRVYGCVC